LPVEKSGKRIHAAEIFRQIEDLDAVGYLVSGIDWQQGAADESEFHILISDNHIKRPECQFYKNRIG